MKQDRNDLLGLFMSEKAGPTDEQIIDNIIGVIFAARDTTATVLTWIVKYLGENPHILEAVAVRIYMPQTLLNNHLMTDNFFSFCCY